MGETKKMAYIYIQVLYGYINTLEWKLNIFSSEIHCPRRFKEFGYIGYELYPTKQNVHVTRLIRFERQDQQSRYEELWA